MQQTIIFFTLLILTAVSLSSLAVNWQQYQLTRSLEEERNLLTQEVKDLETQKLALEEELHQTNVWNVTLEEENKFLRQELDKRDITLAEVRDYSAQLEDVVNSFGCQAGAGLLGLIGAALLP